MVELDDLYAEPPPAPRLTVAEVVDLAAGWALVGLAFAILTIGDALVDEQGRRRARMHWG